MRSDNTQNRGTARGGDRETTRRWDSERRTPNRRYSAGDGSDNRSAEDSSVRRSYGERNDSRPFRKSFSNDRREGGYGERREGGFNRERREGGFNREGRDGFAGKRMRSRISKPSGPKPTGYATPDKPVREDGVRLNKYIANSGICSRREADNFIQAGLVTVNDVIVTELGTRVNPETDVIKFNGEKLRGEEKVYIVMNKPKDFVTTMSDPHAEKTVMHLIEGNCKARVFPVGRLDKSTTGVLLLTNDGDLTERLTHPSYEKKKIYHVHLDKNFKSGDFAMLLDGIILEDGSIKADALSYIDNDKSQIGIEIHSGRNRIVRRLFEYLGYKVKKLDRVYFAGLTKKNLRRGQWRFLTDQEIAMLKMGNYE